jgi:hypothetical protein
MCSGEYLGADRRAEPVVGGVNVSNRGWASTSPPSKRRRRVVSGRRERSSMGSAPGCGLLWCSGGAEFDLAHERVPYAGVVQAKNPVLLLAGAAISTAARASCYASRTLDAGCGW